MWKRRLKWRNRRTRCLTIAILKNEINEDYRKKLSITSGSATRRFMAELAALGIMCL